MKNLNKFIAYILTIFIIFASNSKADDNILPLPRPEIDESVKKIISKKKNIYPKKKPDNKKEKKQKPGNQKPDFWSARSTNFDEKSRFLKQLIVFN